MAFSDLYEIKDNYLIIKENAYIKRKKITGHPFVELCGFSKYAKKGDIALERMGLIKAKEVDIKYLHRGDIAERIAGIVYKRNYEVVTYDKFQIKFDNFPQNPTFGGLIDIDIPSHNFLIEVKSKSLSKFDEICANPPKEEVYQGLMYGVLKNYEKVVMFWVFFDPQAEAEAFQAIWPHDRRFLKKFEKEYILTPELKQEVLNYMNQAKEYLDTCINERRVPLCDISKEALAQLGYQN